MSITQRVDLFSRRRSIADDNVDLIKRDDVIHPNAIYITFISHIYHVYMRHEYIYNIYIIYI